MQKFDEAYRTSPEDTIDLRQRSSDVSDELAWLRQVARLMEPLETPRR